PAEAVAQKPGCRIARQVARAIRVCERLSHPDGVVGRRSFPRTRAAAKLGDSCEHASDCRPELLRLLVLSTRPRIRFLLYHSPSQAVRSASRCEGTSHWSLRHWHGL